MRLERTVSACAMLAGALLMMSEPAAAWHRDRAPDGYGQTRVVHHHVYYPRYVHVYHVHSGTDPYAYRYVRPGYYPYYNSGYWRPAHLVRKHRPHFRLPRYYQAWGYPKHGKVEYRPVDVRHHRHW